MRHILVHPAAFLACLLFAVPAFADSTAVNGGANGSVPATGIGGFIMGIPPQIGASDSGQADGCAPDDSNGSFMGKFWRSLMHQLDPKDYAKSYGSKAGYVLTVNVPLQDHPNGGACIESGRVVDCKNVSPRAAECDMGYEGSTAVIPAGTKIVFQKAADGYEEVADPNHMFILSCFAERPSDGTWYISNSTEIQKILGKVATFTKKGCPASDSPNGTPPATDASQKTVAPGSGGSVGAIGMIGGIGAIGGIGGSSSGHPNQ